MRLELFSDFHPFEILGFSRRPFCWGARLRRLQGPQKYLRIIQCGADLLGHIFFLWPTLVESIESEDELSKFTPLVQGRVAVPQYQVLTVCI